MTLEPNRHKTCSLIHGTAAPDEHFGVHRANYVNDLSNKHRAEAGHRDHRSTLLAENRNRRV